MNIIAALVLGVLIGWLVEWVIDWFYWRGRIRALAEEHASLAEANANLEAENVNLKAESANLNERIAALETKVNKKSQLSKTRPIQDRAGKDNLQAIRGVGPVISKRLNEAGIYTFEEMAQLTSEELEEILGSLIKKFFPGEEKMIAQAKEFAAQKTQRTS